MEEFLKTDADFAFRFLRQLSPKETTIFSPFSIKCVLLLVHAGAGGNSRSEIVKTLHGDVTDEDFLYFYSSVKRELEAVRGNLRIANRVFINKEKKLHQWYLDGVTERYGAGAESIDVSKAKQSVEKINNFVSVSTEGKITEMVDEFSVSGATAILINAIYFKEKWQKAFKLLDTKPLVFHTVHNTEKKIDFMFQLSSFKYFDNHQMQMISLPYQQQDFEFIIILPREKFGLNAVLNDISGTLFHQWMNCLVEKERIELYIPKMKIEYQVRDLKAVLVNLGIFSIFESNLADLSKITAEPLWIAGGVHKAIIEVDEEGTVAAAATGLAMFGCAQPLPYVPPTIFLADHPFLYFITFKKHIMFAGTMQR